MSEAHEEHGHTIAAWTAVSVAVAGFAFGCVGVVMASPLVFWIGVALLPVALIAGKVLALMGLGAKAKS